MRTVYYDVETDSKYAPYALLKICGLLWDDGTEEIFTFPLSNEEKTYLQRVLADPDIKKVGFNNCNYDDLVLYRHGFPVCEQNRHDGFLAAKTLWPEMPSFALKFLNWWLFGDFHWPEYDLFKATPGMTDGNRFADGPTDLLEIYNAHDLYQHKRLWEYLEPLLADRAAEAYALDLSQGKVIEQMIFEGGLHIDRKKCEKMIRVLEVAMNRNQYRVAKLTKFEVMNANSNKQLGAYFTSLGYELDHTSSGEFQVDKETIEDLWRLEPVAKCVKNVRKINSMLKYYRNYIKAIDDPTFVKSKQEDWLPTSFSISGARSRRYTSSSKHGLNFQNPSSNAKKVQTVPEGWLGFWIDSTQIENVVHIYESKDWQRRKAYENDPEWSEYVWLCNMILGTNLGKDELDSIKSAQNELWSIYKQYKTIKLMMNFGAGVKKFADVAGFAMSDAKKLFADIHRACPAIRRLQKRVQQDYEIKGEVYDTFGHVYRVCPDASFKLVAYLIQGCGTGSLPKAQLRSNYDTLEHYKREYNEQVGVLCVTTHDETAGRLRLDLGPDGIDEILNDLMFNMTKKYEHKFDNIPLRAKLYLATHDKPKRKQVKTYAEYLKK